MRGVVFVNELSGPDDTPIDELEVLLPGAEVISCPPDELPQAVAAALERSPSIVAVAGGDGTIRCVAQALIGTPVPLLVVPAGTRNHFAKDVGIDSFEAAGRAWHDGATGTVDVGEVNGHTFLNNSSIGLYPKIVVQRRYHEHRMPKAVAQIVAAWVQLRKGGRLAVDVEVEGERIRSWLVFVGNGRYGEGLFDLADRESLDDGLLDVRVVRADPPLARLRVVAALLLGRLARSPLIVSHRTSSITIDVARERVEVALDGEVEHLEPPLRYECRPRALTIAVPRER